MTNRREFLTIAVGGAGLLTFPVAIVAQPTLLTDQEMLIDGVDPAIPKISARGLMTGSEINECSRYFDARALHIDTTWLPHRKW